eukprot:CAMPEP_0115365692 /NCGR_PEP_ID=MMETSP0270-20121206/104416_1 /TAXON_ID=71861 /ORGANISM="Scrippsiella trochoidea, Strain CCMP3099" /LENGTH=402 /DNA_ID=CAMNT_0002788431 /DNA_START=160 /DNA_END=1367 /DNA_ORIENTATION=+
MHALLSLPGLYRHPSVVTQSQRRAPELLHRAQEFLHCSPAQQPFDAASIAAVPAAGLAGIAAATAAPAVVAARFAFGARRRTGRAASSWALSQLAPRCRPRLLRWALGTAAACPSSPALRQLLAARYQAWLLAAVCGDLFARGHPWGFAGPLRPGLHRSAFAVDSGQRGLELAPQHLAAIAAPAAPRAVTSDLDLHGAYPTFQFSADSSASTAASPGLQQPGPLLGPTLPPTLPGLGSTTPREGPSAPKVDVTNLPAAAGFSGPCPGPPASAPWMMPPVPDFRAGLLSTDLTATAPAHLEQGGSSDLVDFARKVLGNTLDPSSFFTKGPESDWASSCTLPAGHPQTADTPASSLIPASPGDTPLQIGGFLDLQQPPAMRHSLRDDRSSRPPSPRAPLGAFGA